MYSVTYKENFILEISTCSVEISVYSSGVTWILYLNFSQPTP